jgi:hypothetical protein
MVQSVKKFNEIIITGGVYKELDLLRKVNKRSNCHGSLVMSDEGNAHDHHIFPKGLKIHSEEYLKVLEDKPWMDKIPEECHHVF